MTGLSVDGLRAGEYNPCDVRSSRRIASLVVPVLSTVGTVDGTGEGAGGANDSHGATRV